MSWKPWLAAALILAPAGEASAGFGDPFTPKLLKTENGCLYYSQANVFEPEIIAQIQAGLVAKLNGPACRPGEFIDGYGTLTEYEDGRWSSGYYNPRITTTTGRLANGAWEGPIRTSNGPVDEPSRYSATYEMKGGCPLGQRGDCIPILPRAATTNGAAADGESEQTAVPPLRPTLVQEAHNPAGEASDCVRVIYEEDFEVEHVSTTQKAVFRNRCSRPIEVSWCTLTDDCRPGYTNLATVPAKKDRGFSYEPSVAGSKVAYAACYNGFVQHQSELSKKLLHACK
jgi:hypothetical protein